MELKLVCGWKEKMLSLKYAIIDVNPWHLRQLWGRICMPSGFFPDLWVGPANSESLISFMKKISGYPYIALPIQSLYPIWIDTPGICIVHQDSRIQSESLIYVNQQPASSAVVYKLLEIWRNSHVT